MDKYAAEKIANEYYSLGVQAALRDLTKLADPTSSYGISMPGGDPRSKETHSPKIQKYLDTQADKAIRSARSKGIHASSNMSMPGGDPRSKETHSPKIQKYLDTQADKAIRSARSK